MATLILFLSAILLHLCIDTTGAEQVETIKALWPAVAMAAGAAISAYGASKRGKGRLRVWQPTKGDVQAGYGRTIADVEQLRRPSPYATDPSLGYSQQVKMGMLGEGSRPWETARQGELQTIGDVYRRAGSVRRLGGSRYLAEVGARGRDLGRRAGHRRQIMIANAAQQRADFDRRADLSYRSFRDTASLYNRGQLAQHQDLLRRQGAKADLYQGIGSALMGGGLKAYGGGTTGGSITRGRGRYEA